MPTEYPIWYPHEDEQLYELTRLPDPPEDWVFHGWTAETLVRDRVNRASFLEELVKHHLWGMEYKEHNKARFKKDNVKTLWKLFYHMQEQHLPKSWAEVFNKTRDAGPRLLKWDLNPRPPPVSAHYPKRPRVLLDSLPAGYVRPAGAPDDIPDSYIIQAMYSAEPLNVNDAMAELRTPPNTTATRSPLEKRRADTSTDKNAQNQKKRRVEAPAPLGQAGTIGPTGSYAPTPEQVPLPAGNDAFWANPLPVAQMPSPPADIPSGVSPPRIHVPAAPGSSPASPPPTDSSMGPPPNEPAFVPDSLKVEAEKLMMKHAYSDLQRHPEAPYQGPIPTQVATHISHLGVVQSGAFSSVRALRLNTDNLELDPNGHQFPYRGRGPAGTVNTCFIDCVIMMGKLLDAGCTVADRKEDRSSRFTDIERAFIEITNMNWDAFDERVSGELRDSFHRLLCTTYPQLMIGHTCPPWSTWSVATKHFEQFRYYYTTEKTRCTCKGKTIKSSEKHGNYIGSYLVDGDENGVTVQQLVERSWPARTHYVCKHCGAGEGTGGPSISKRITRLPLRLVVLPILGTKLVNHTDPVEFSYLDGYGKPCKALYRWLGGIYFHGEYARVWWSDAERGDSDQGDLRMYDGTQVSGTMFGGIPPCSVSDRVSLAWVQGDCPPMLVYEQVLNPSIDQCFTVLETVNTLGQIVQQGKHVLAHHEAWTPKRDPPVVRYPWRLLPSFGDIFLNSKRPDPFDTLPHDPAFIDVRDWVSLRHLNDNDPRLEPFKEHMKLVPLNFGDPPPPPPDTQFFDSLLQNPFIFLDQPHMWPQGIPDVAGINEFPALPESPDARPTSRGSQGSRFTFADWMDMTEDAPQGSSGSKKSKGSAGSKKSQSSDLSMRDAILVKNTTGSPIKRARFEDDERAYQRRTRRRRT